MSADEHGAVGVVDNTIADTAHEGPPERVQAARAHDDHDGAHGLLVLDDLMPGILPPDHFEHALDLQ